MRNLVKYASTADFMNVAIELDKKVFRFNLDSELKILLTNMTNELRDQPRSYAFLAMLRNKLIVKQRDEQKVLKRKKDRLFLKFKESTEKVTEATARVNADAGIQKLEDNLERITELKDVLDICINAFEQRSRLLQTLSANERPKQNN